MTVVIIGITGLAGSGKTLLSEHAKRKGFMVYREGDYIRAEAARRGLRDTHENLSNIALEFLPSRNLEIIKSITASVVNKDFQGEQMVIVEGIKKMSEVNFLRNKFKTYIIAVLASSEVRYTRMIKRGRVDDPTSYRTFNERDRRELAHCMGKVIALADFFIINEGDPTEAENAFNDILNSIQKSIGHKKAIHSL